MKEFSYRTRRQHLEEACSGEVDLLVIGGGITGAGIARDAVLRGMRVALFERRDFGHATSSKTSKLIHGGLRYLQQLQISLVRDSLRERKLLAQLAPGLVSWIQIVIPLYRPADAVKFRLGLRFYDALAREPERQHRPLGRRELEGRFACLRDGLRAGLEYWDCVMDDSRLTLAVTASAAEHGAMVANYAEVTALIKPDGAGGPVQGARIRDVLSDAEMTVRASVVVNAGGPWVDRLRRLDDPSAPATIRHSRGAHILLARQRLGLDSALALPLSGGRLLFGIPWQGRVLLGTTESGFEGDPDCVPAESAELDFILGLASSLFPEARLGRSDILASFAGVRPLVDDRHSSLSRVSREHRILESRSGLISIAGGKYTTFRRMAEQVVDRVAERLGAGKRRFGPCRTAELPLDRAIPPAPATLPSPEETARSVRGEMTVSLSDLLIRRSKAALVAQGQGLEEADPISRALAAELGWSEAERQRQLAAYHNEVKRCFRRGESF